MKLEDVITMTDRDSGVRRNGLSRKAHYLGKDYLHHQHGSIYRQHVCGGGCHFRNEIQSSYPKGVC